MENGRDNEAKAAEIRVSGIHMEWNPTRGTCTFEKMPVAMMWVDTTLAGLMSGVQAMVGTERFLLALQSEGRKSVEADWGVIAQFPGFSEGFQAIANIAAVAGWGEWQLASLDEEKKECRFRVIDSWEGRYQKALGVCWGSGVIAGKMAGYCSKLFGTNCWADQTAFIARGDAFDGFVVRPSSRSLETEIENLLASDEASRADLAVALRKLEKEIIEREQADRHIARLATFPQLNPNPVLEIDFSGRITFYNAASLKSLAQMGSAAGIEAFLPRDIAAILKEAKKTGKNRFNREVKIANSFFEEHISITAGLDAARIYAWDITESKRAGEELNQNLRKMTLLNKISHLISSSISLEDMVNAAVNGIAEYLDADLVIFFLKEDAKLPLLIIGPQDSRYKIDSMPSHCVGECLCGLAAQDGKPTYSQDISTDPRCTMVECKKAGLRSFAALPLKSGNRVIGILGLASAAPRDFEKESSLLETLAAEISLCLRNSLLLEEATRRTEELSQEVTEHKRTEEALRKSEEEIKSIFRAAPIGIGLVVNRIIKGANDRLCAMLEYRQEELIGQSARMLYPRVEEYNWVGKEKYEQIADKGTGTVETLWRKKDGTLINVLLSSTPLDLHDLRKGVTFTALDITERKRVEDAYRSLVTHSPFGIYIIQKGKFRMVNPGFEEITGYRGGELLGKDPLILVAPEYKNIVRQRAIEMLKGASSRPYEYQFLNKHGDRGWVMETVTPTEFAGERATLGYFMDITERRQAEVARKESEERLRLAVEASSIGLWDWNFETNRVYFSPEWKRQLGYEVDELPNRLEEWENRLHPEDYERTLGSIKAYLANPWPDFESEFRLRHREGSYRWILARGALQFDQAGKPVRMTGAHLDVTRQKLMEKELAEAGEQLRGLAMRLAESEDAERKRLARELHDQVGQNLTALSINLNLVTSSLPESVEEPARSRLANSIALIQQTGKVIRNLMAELRPPVLDDYGLLAALRWYAGEFTALAGIALEVKGEELRRRLEPPIENALFRIAQEALTNAAKHSQAQKVVVSLEEHENQVKMTIVDNGLGFDPAGLSKPEGDHGWGLLTMRERALAVKGCCLIVPGQGQGTRVEVKVSR
jgi:PAS domain S-box-containing protein